MATNFRLLSAFEHILQDIESFSCHTVNMKKETRTVFYDEDLQIEAYRFEGITQPFPVHFHDYYVIGFIESGGRHLTCENAEHSVGEGDILLFNPHDKHACTQADGGTLDYRAFNIKADVMDTLAKEITGRKFALKFNKNVVRDAELFSALRALHEMLMRESKEYDVEHDIYDGGYQKKIHCCLTVAHAAQNGDDDVIAELEYQSECVHPEIHDGHFKQVGGRLQDVLQHKAVNRKGKPRAYDAHANHQQEGSASIFAQFFAPKSCATIMLAPTEKPLANARNAIVKTVIAPTADMASSLSKLSTIIVSAVL